MSNNKFHRWDIYIQSKFTLWRHRVGPFGSEWNNLLKRSFWVIIDYILPDFVKMLLLLDNCKATDEDFDKLSKASKYQYE